MKAALLVVFVALLSGCSLVRQPPSEAKAQALEYGRRDAESAQHARAEAAKLEERGLTTREASSLADARRRVAR